MLMGCVSIAPPAGTVLAKVVEPNHASMVYLSTDGQNWTPVAEGYEDQFYLVLARTDSKGRPYQVRVAVSQAVWDVATVGCVYAPPGEGE